MNDDYLWDRSGEPDPEIQRLEETLGTLRYQPQPLTIPAHLQVRRKRFLFSSLAIAAAIALMFVWAGWWMFLNRLRPYDSAAARPTPTATMSNASVSSQKPGSGDYKAVKSSDDEKKAQRRPQRVTSPTLARNPTGGRTLVAKKSEVTADERLEAQAAKEQLLLALRVASSKLSLAQKRAQGTYPGNMIRNQHKVG